MGGSGGAHTLILYLTFFRHFHLEVMFDCELTRILHQNHLNYVLCCVLTVSVPAGCIPTVSVDSSTLHYDEYRVRK